MESAHRPKASRKEFKAAAARLTPRSGRRSGTRIQQEQARLLISTWLRLQIRLQYTIQQALCPALDLVERAVRARGRARSKGNHGNVRTQRLPSTLARAACVAEAAA